MNKRERLTYFGGLLIFLFGALFSVYLLGRGQANWLLRLFFASDVILSPRPGPFSSIHWISLAVCVLLTLLMLILACRLSRAWMDKHTDRIVFLCGLAFGLMEYYKQVYCFYVVNGGVYDYGQFPFQFCSLPIYLCLTMPILPKGAVKDAGYRFLALFGTVGGALVIFYPRLSERLYLSAHTIVWHILMVVLGAYLLVATECGRSFRRDFVPTACIFLSVISLATLLNVLCAELDNFQLLYMSPYHKTTFVILDKIQEHWGWLPAMLGYVLSFLFLAALPLWLFGRFLLRRREKRTKMLEK